MKRIPGAASGRHRHRRNGQPEFRSQLKMLDLPIDVAAVGGSDDAAEVAMRAKLPLTSKTTRLLSKTSLKTRPEKLPVMPTDDVVDEVRRVRRLSESHQLTTCWRHRRERLRALRLPACSVAYSAAMTKN